MASFIEDYALLSDMSTAALVSREGSVDWFCTPRFDSEASFAALLGTPDHGRWLLAPAAAVFSSPEGAQPRPAEPQATGVIAPVDSGAEDKETPWAMVAERFYGENSLVLHTVWTTDTGSVRVTDFMPLNGRTELIRRVEGLTGEVTMHQEVAIRFSFGRTRPWLTRYDGAPDPVTGYPDPAEAMLVAMAGPDAMVFRGDPVPEQGERCHAGQFQISAGQVRDFTLTYFASHRNPPAAPDVNDALHRTVAHWSEWSALYADPSLPAPAPHPSAPLSTTAMPVVSPETQALSRVEGQEAVPPQAHDAQGSAFPTTFSTTPGTAVPGQEGWDRGSSDRQGLEPDAVPGSGIEPAEGSAPAQDVPQAEDPRFAGYREARLRSLLVLRALMSRETGGLIAAPTTSLPEVMGGERNWDHRFCWLRDVAQAVDASVAHGHEREAAQLRNWLLRAIANDPAELHNVYGLAGETDALERVVDFLPGYEDSRPVRRGNGAAGQLQGDAMGQLMLTFERLRVLGFAEDHLSWPLQQALLRTAVAHVGEEDQGIWEMHGDTHVYTHSQVMLWAALDAGVRAVRVHGLAGEDQAWAAARDRLADQIWEHGYDAELNSFVQVYGGREVDSSLLNIAQVGFVAFGDPRMLGTAARIQRELGTESGLIYRYRNSGGLDGIEGQDNPHMASSLWLAEQHIRAGNLQEGTAILDAVLERTNDVGLLSTEYSLRLGRMTGNFPQSLAHIALIGAVDALFGE